MTRLEIQGIVFDVDGVLFDTERLTHQTWKTVSREMGWPQVGEAYLEFVGQNRTDIFRKMVELFGEEFPKETFMKVCSAYSQARMEREGVPMKPGVREILAFLKERGIPTALATSTGRPRTERRMEMTGLGPYFSAIITGDQVVHSKPDPEIYLLACQALGTDPKHTIAVEDSRNGILSASRAGMQVIMVPDMIPPPQSWRTFCFAAAPTCWRYGSCCPRFCPGKIQRQGHGFGAVFFRHAFARISEVPCGLSELLQEMFQKVSDSFSSLQFLNILFAGIILLFSAIGNILGWQLF